MRVAWLLGLLLLSGAFAVNHSSQSAPAVAAGGSAPLLDEVGKYTLHDLGYADITLRAGDPGMIGVLPGSPPKRYAPVRVEYRLPEDAAQGPDVWYVLHFHFEVQFAEETEGGRATVYADPNRWTAAIVNLVPTAESGSLRVDWSGRGLTEGLQTGTAYSNRVDVRFSNYLPNGGVLPGVNHLSFSVRDRDGITTEIFRVFDDTTIEVTPLAPPNLVMEGGQIVRDEGDPETVQVLYSVGNAGGWPAKDVATEVSYDADSLLLVGEPSATIPVIEGSESVDGSFTFEVMSPGLHRVSLSTHTQGGGSVGATVTFIGGAGEESVPKWRFWALWGGVVVASMLPFVPYRRLLRAGRRRFSKK